MQAPAFRKPRGALLLSDALIALLAVLILFYIVSAVIFAFYDRWAAEVENWEEESLLLSAADRLVKADAVEGELVPAPSIHPNVIDMGRLHAAEGWLSAFNMSAHLESEGKASGRCIRRIVLVSGEVDALAVCR